MNKPKILVTGATGKTGSPVVRKLLALGFPVRALIRKHDARSARLADMGAELSVGDYMDIESLRLATRGVERLYFCYPPESDRLLEASSNMAIVAKDAGVRGLVNMSQLTSREGAPSPLTRQHWLAEKVFDWAGVDAVHIRPSFFTEMLSMFAAQSIAAEGKLYFPYGQERHAAITSEDIAEVVATILSDPQPHAGERYLLTGPELLSMAEMAGVLSTELGTEIEYVDLPIEQWGQVLEEVVGIPSYLVKHLKAVAQDHQDGVFDQKTDLVRRITGREAQSIADYVRSNPDHFAGQSALQHV